MFIRGSSIFDSLHIASRVADLNEQSQSENFWDDPVVAQSIVKELSHKRKIIDTWETLQGDLTALEEIFALISEDQTEDIADMEIQLKDLEIRYKEAKMNLFLSDTYDIRDCILNIATGTGGTDAQDFSEMLLRMYMRYAEKKGYKTTLLEKSDGSDAGIKSASIEIRGEMAYGYLKGENGVHRLIRQSPFNSKGLRQTSFSLVEILPVLESSDEVSLDNSDLRIDTFRASGAGGQHVNTTDSAVRITHIPTGLVSQCQSERSQAQNKDRALKILQAKLLKKKRDQEEKEAQKLKGEFKEIDFGSQIRTYTLHPYKLVKDHRTNIETGNVDAVLDGDLDAFIEAGLEL